MRSNILRVIPKTYKLFFDKQALKNINPYLNVSSGSYANMSKVVTYEGDKPKIETSQEAKNNIFVELRDSETGRLLGKNQIQYDSLPDQKCNFEETVPLRNSEGEEIGEAVLEVQVAPRKSGFLGFWEEKPQLEAEENAAETKKLEGNEDAKTLKSESESAQKEESVMKEETAKTEEAIKKEEPLKTAEASKESNEKAVRAQEIKSRDLSLEEVFPMHRDMFYDFERSRREMDRIFNNFETVFGDRMFSGFGDEFRRVMRTFDRLEREMFRDFDDFMLPFRRGQYYLEEEMPTRGRSLEGKQAEKKAEKAESKAEEKVEKEQKSESKEKSA